MVRPINELVVLFQSVSNTGVESIKSVKDIFQLVDKDDLHSKALKIDLELISTEENILPNGKLLFTYEFGKVRM